MQLEMLPTPARRLHLPGVGRFESDSCRGRFAANMGQRRRRAGFPWRRPRDVPESSANELGSRSVGVRPETTRASPVPA